MTHMQTLTHHRDIQTWVSKRRGMPAIARVRDRFGEVRAQLKLSFSQVRQTPHNGLDDGLSPCSWSAWLAELDRQHLALKVDPAADDFEIVERN